MPLPDADTRISNVVPLNGLDSVMLATARSGAVPVKSMSSNPKLLVKIGLLKTAVNLTGLEFVGSICVVD